MATNILEVADINHQRAWAMCLVCDGKFTFENPRDFVRHLRSEHCAKEGGSFVCRYGRNGVCQSLPVEGVSDVDYEDHVQKHHVGLILKNDISHACISSLHENKMICCVRLPPISFKEQDWTFFSSTQNLTAVLNDPNDRKRSKEFFTKTWGAEFELCEVPPLTLLQTVSRNYFCDYTRRMQFRIKNHERVKKSFENGEELGDLGDTGFSKAAACVVKRQGDKNLHNLDAIPKTFMDANFCLEDPETFKYVIPMTLLGTVDAKHRNRSALITVPRNSLKLMQEKLTHFLDTTEVALAHQISLRSEDFFRAVSSQDQLEDDVGQTNSEIKKLRTKIKQVQNVMCGGPFKLMQLMQLRARYHAVHNKLKLMSAVQQTQPTIQQLLSTGDFVAALDLISTTQEVLQLELGGLQSLRHLGSQLAELERVIERMMESDFIEFATANLAKPLEDYDEQDEVIDEERLVSVLFGLLRKQKFHFIHAYKEEAFATVKEMVKETARNFVSQCPVADESQGLRDAMQDLHFHGWLNMLEVVFRNVLQTLTRMKILHHSFLNVLAVAAGHRRAESSSVGHFSLYSGDILISSFHCGKLTNESKDILGGAGELAQARCVKLINVRAKAGYLDALASTEFVCLSKTVEKFVSECEEVCGRQSHALRTILVTHAKRFVERFHEERKQKLSLILDSERWKHADVPTEFQTLVDSLLDGVPSAGNRELPSLSSNKQGVPSAGNRELPSLSSNKQASSVSLPQKPASHLVVNGEKFVVAGTLLLVLKMIVEYCQCVDLMPMLTADIMTRLFELMKMFNSRTCQLVLGAGALQLVGLKTITAKHLALASRCLEVITLHIATFKSHFELRLPPKQYVLLGQFDQILKDYNNHRQEIFAKMATLMEELFVEQLLTWEVRPPMPSHEMRSIVKQIIKLHEALLAIFPATQVEIVMRDVKKSFKKTLSKKIASLGLKNDFGPQHGLVQSDVAYFCTNLKSLHGMKDIEDHLGDIWKLSNELRTANTPPLTMNKKTLPSR